MKNLLSTILLFLCLFHLTAQPSIEWQKTYGGSEIDQAYSIQQTNDGGYIVVGNSNSLDGDIADNNGESDYWVIKLSADNSIEWRNNLGGAGVDGANAVQQTSDGGYIISGYSNSADGDVTSPKGTVDLWIVKLSSIGNLVWQKSLGGTDWDFPGEIKQTLDGGYIVTGYVGSTDGDITDNNGDFDLWLVKLDDTGSILWQKCLGGTNADIGYSLEQTTDGGFIIAGYSRSSDGDVSNNQGEVDSWIVKVDNVGTLEWQKSYGGSNYDYALSAQQTNDGGYIVGGYTYSSDGDITNNNGDSDCWILKLNNTGELEWQKTFGGSAAERAYQVLQTIDGKYIVTGFTESTDGDITNNHGDRDYWIIQLSSIGELEWEKTFGGSDEDFAASFQQTDDGGFIIAGFSSSTDGDVTDPHGESDFWVVKLTGDPVSVNNISETAMLSVFPNPTKGELNITVALQLIGKDYTIYDSLGKRMATGKIRNENTSLNLGSLSAGVYSVQIEGQDKMIGTRFIIK